MYYVLTYLALLSFYLPTLLVIDYLNQEWLRGYRLGGGGKDGGAAVYLLSRQQLQKWWYVDKMTPTELQEKYRVECGVYADRAHLVRWVQVFSHARMLFRYVQNVFKSFFVVVGICH